MYQFRPTRASPPSKSFLLPDHTLDSSHTDISRRSVVSVPELTGLTEQEVELLDTVIQRAGYSATTFLTVFKAYNDVLNERGLDPHEVLYYGKLLKLGTLKGSSWGDKWSMVKKQYHYHGSHSDTRGQGHFQLPASNRLPKHTHGRVKSQLLQSSEASFTLHSCAGESELEMDQDSAGASPVKLRQPLSSDEMEKSPYINDIGRHPVVSQARRVRGLTGHPRGRRWETDASDATGEHIPSTTPPSYRAALRDPRLCQEQSPSRSFAITGQPPVGDSARKAVAMAREQRGSITNEQDAWNKIKLERDEKDADDFRSDRLLERCWDVWKEGFQWIIVRSVHLSFRSEQG